MNASEAALAAHVNDIQSYYEQTYLDYRLLWMNPDTLAMHFGFWDERTHSHAEALLNMNRVLGERAGMQPGHRVLDAGCGIGGSAIWLARELGVEVVGITLVPSQVARGYDLARRHGVAGRVTFECQDFTCTRFPNGSFDIVWAIESVCHALDKRDFLAEARRLLRSGGRLVVADWFRHRRPFGPADERLLNDWLSGWAVPDLTTADEFAQAARQVGFGKVRLDDVTANVRPSLRRLYHLALLCYGPALFLRAVRLRTEKQAGNARSALKQYQAMQRGLWFYGIVTATR